MLSATTSPKSNVLFIFGDGHHGHEMVKGMCSFLEEHKDVLKSFVAVVDKGFKDEMKDIKHSEVCHIEAVDLQHKEKACEQLQEIMKKRDINWLVVLPAGETFNSGCVQGALESYKKHGGENIVMLSIAGVDKCNQEFMKKLHEAEKMVQKQFPKTSVILRKQLPFIYLDYFLDSVKEKKAWRLPTGSGKFAPLAWVKDIGMVVGVVCSHENVCNEWAGKTFTLTGKESIDGGQLADMTKTAFKDDVKFEDISMEEAGKILEKFVDEGKEKEMGGKHKLNRRLLNKVERSAILSVFEMVRKGEYAETTDHFKKITGKEPTSVEEYIRSREEKLRE